ncbi:hypothetical protein F5883DRAFT_102260 [Diaporthe sp. PMI_573]|nr:hypothetical protein F5883DRAFT_102260 [Diaporthaceae sp. PMI_573]
MGLGSKIKEALHGDHHDKTTTDARPPGAFPQDDIPQRHADGKDYIAPHGSLIDKNRNTGTTGTTGSGLGSTHVGDADSLGHSDTQRNKLHKEGEGYLPSEADHTTSTHDTRGHKPVDSGIGLGTSGRDRTSEGAYWGDLSPSGHASKGNHGLSQDLPDRGHGEYSPIGTAQNVSSLPDRTTHGHGLGHDQTAGGTSHHSPLHGDQPVGSGVYNTVAGAGSPDYDRSHGSAKPHVSGGAVHDPLTSGTTGAGVTSGRNEYDYKTSLGGAGAPTSRDDRTTGPGPVGGERGLGQGALSQGGLTGSGLSGSGLGGNGLSGSSVGRSQGYGDSGLTHHDHSTGHGNSHAGAGLAGAGVAAAAGYGANEFAHRGQGNTGHGGPHDSTSSHHAPGVPRSSMLDVEPSGGVTGSHHGHQAAGVPHSTSLGLGSERNVTPPHHGSHGIGGGSPTNVGSGFGTHMGQSSPASSGHGTGHYGPGHSGAKVS